MIGGILSNHRRASDSRRKGMRRANIPRVIRRRPKIVNME
jgi:hypothetical protein